MAEKNEKITDKFKLKEFEEECKEKVESIKSFLGNIKEEKIPEQEIKQEQKQEPVNSQVAKKSGFFGFFKGVITLTKDTYSKISNKTKNIYDIAHEFVTKDKKTLEENREKIKKILEDNDWFVSYLLTLQSYIQLSYNDNAYKNKLTQYIDDTRQEYKNCMNELSSSIEKKVENIIKILDEKCKKVKKEKQPEMKELKKKFEQTVKIVEENFGKTVKSFKDEFRNLKIFGANQNSYRVETLKHSLLYCKSRVKEKSKENNELLEQISSSNKLGFLDYLLAVSMGGNKDKLKEKLRSPFKNCTDLDTGKIIDAITNFKTALSKSWDNDKYEKLNFSMIKKFNNKCSKIVSQAAESIQSLIKMAKTSIESRNNLVKNLVNNLNYTTNLINGAIDMALEYFSLDEEFKKMFTNYAKAYASCKLFHNIRDIFIDEKIFSDIDEEGKVSRFFSGIFGGTSKLKRLFLWLLLAALAVGLVVSIVSGWGMFASSGITALMGVVAKSLFSEYVNFSSITGYIFNRK